VSYSSPYARRKHRRDNHKGRTALPHQSCICTCPDVQTKMVTIVLSNAQENIWSMWLQVLMRSGQFRRVQERPPKRSDIKVADGQTVNLNFKMQKGTLQWSQLTQVPGRDAAADTEVCTGSEGETCSCRIVLAAMA